MGAGNLHIGTVSALILCNAGATLMPNDGIAVGFSLKKGSHLGLNTAVYAGLFGFVSSFNAYCSDSCSLRSPSDGSLASTSRPSIGDVRKAPRQRRSASLVWGHIQSVLRMPYCY